MTDNNHPITPPPKLIQQWWDDIHGASYEFDAVVTQATRWGADQELEACCKWIEGEIGAIDPKDLFTARRPNKSPSLKEQALAVVENSAVCDHLSIEHAAILRRALNSLPD